jgi:hypothetical protein
MIYNKDKMLFVNPALFVALLNYKMQIRNLKFITFSLQFSIINELSIKQLPIRDYEIEI